MTPSRIRALSGSCPPLVQRSSIVARIALSNVASGRMVPRLDMISR